MTTALLLVGIVACYAVCGATCYRWGYRKGEETTLVAAMRESVVQALSRKLPAVAKPNAITADAIATALETSRNATVYHDTNSTGPLVATWMLERKH